MKLHILCRSGASNGAGGINKLDGTSLVASSNTRGMTKMEHERAATPKDLADGLNKERHPTKGSNKYVFTHSSMLYRLPYF